MSADDQYGRLREKARRKKQVDVWTFYSPFADAKARKAGYVATIMLVNDHRKGLMFRALSDYFRPPIEDTDIARLRKKVEKAFQLADMAAREIKWEDWIEIEMSEEFHYNEEHGAMLDVNWKFLKRGVHPVSGEAFTINNNGVVVPFPKPKLAGEEDPRDGDRWYHSRNKDTQFSYVEATPANVASLESLATRMRELRERLRELLSQDRAQLSLKKELLVLPRAQ